MALTVKNNNLNRESEEFTKLLNEHTGIYEAEFEKSREQDRKVFNNYCLYRQSLLSFTQKSMIELEKYLAEEEIIRSRVNIKSSENYRKVSELTDKRQEIFDLDGRCTRASMEISRIEKNISESEREIQVSLSKIKNFNQRSIDLKDELLNCDLLIRKINEEINEEEKMITELEKEIKKNEEDLDITTDMMTEKKLDILKKEFEFQEINRKKREMIENEINALEKTNLEIEHNLKFQAEKASYIPASPSSQSLICQKFQVSSVIPQESEEVTKLLLKVQSLEQEIATETDFLNAYEQDNYEKSIKLQNPADSSVSFWTLFLSCALGVLTMMILSSIH